MLIVDSTDQKYKKIVSCSTIFLDEKLLSFFLFALSFLFIQCDETRNTFVTPLRDYEEQRTADNDSIVSFLQSHYYNYDDYANAASTEHVEFTIDSLINNPDKTPMIDQVVEQEVKIKDADGNYISHTMYVIPDVRQGVGESPSFADDAYVTYKGMFLDGYSFDSNDQPTWFSGLSTVRGFYELLPYICLLYTSPSPRDRTRSRMPSSA